MTDIYQTPRTTCPSCFGAISRQITATRDSHYGISGEWNWDACSACGLWFLNPAPTEAFLYGEGYDDESYYAFRPFQTEVSAVRRLLWLFLRYDPKATGDPSFSRPGRMLDIGCGSGEFLYRWRQKGWEVYGIEPSKAAALMGRERYSIDIEDDWSAAEKYPDGFFDYIRMNHSFEHMLLPDEALAFVRRKLRQDGKLFIGVPNVASLPRRLFGRHWWNLGAPLHLYGWSMKALYPIMARNNLKVERWRTNSNFSGLLGSLQIKANARHGIHQDTGSLLSNPVLKIIANTAAKIIDLTRSGDCLEVIVTKVEERDTVEPTRQVEYEKGDQHTINSSKGLFRTTND